MSQSLRCDSTQIDFNENSLESSIFFYAYNTFNPTNWNVINNNFIIEAMRFVHFVWLIRWIIDNYLRILEILRKSAVRMLYKLKCNRRHFQWFRWSKSIKIGQFQQINRCLVYIHRIEMKIIDNNNWSMMLPIIIDKSPSIYLPNKIEGEMWIPWLGAIENWQMIQWRFLNLCSFRPFLLFSIWINVNVLTWNSWCFQKK